MHNVLSPRDLVSRPDNMDETVLSSSIEIQFEPLCDKTYKMTCVPCYV